MRVYTPIDLVQEQLRDLYSAEAQLSLALPRVAVRVHSDSLRSAIESHAKCTRDQAARIERIAGELGFPYGNKRCPATMGLLARGTEAMGLGGNAELIDLAIIGASQNIEHFEIASYQAVISLAKEHSAMPGHLIDLLQQSLEEEQDASSLLDEVAGQIYKSGASRRASAASSLD